MHSNVPQNSLYWCQHISRFVSMLFFYSCRTSSTCVSEGNLVMIFQLWISVNFNFIFLTNTMFVDCRIWGGLSYFSILSFLFLFPFFLSVSNSWMWSGENFAVIFIIVYWQQTCLYLWIPLEFCFSLVLKSSVGETFPASLCMMLNRF